MRRRRWLLAVLLGLVGGLTSACGPGSAPGGSDNGAAGTASCVAPSLDDHPPGVPPRRASPSVAPGATITIYGHWYSATCHDTAPVVPDEPLRSVSLTLRLPGGALVPLGTFAPAGPDLGFSVEVTIPPETRPGVATVRDDQPSPHRFDLTVR